MAVFKTGVAACSLLSVIALIPLSSIRAASPTADSKPAASEGAASRPISQAERAAVQFAINYLEKGPSALWNALSPGSPLRSLKRDEALREIEVRAGPSIGSTWSLETIEPLMADKAAVFNVEYPSGIDDVLVMSLTRSGGGFQIENLRTLAEPSPRNGSAAAAVGPRIERGRWSSTNRMLLLIAAGALLFSLVAAKWIKPRKLSVLLIALSLALAVTGGAIGVLKHRGSVALHKRNSSPAANQQVLRLDPLLAMRRQITGGRTDLKSIRVPVSKGVTRQVALLWKAQTDLWRNDIPRVESVLSEFATPSEFPLAELLRARLAYLRADEINAIAAYERATSVSPGGDGIWIEAAGAMASFGSEVRAEQYYRRLNTMHSREPSVYYDLAGLSVIQDDLPAAEKFLKHAWQLKPVERRELLEMGFLVEVLRRPAFKNMLNISSADEPVMTSPALATRAIALPSGAVATVTAEQLHIALGQSEMIIPGGAPLAPANARLADAALLRREEDENALRTLPELLKQVSSPGSYSEPTVALRVASALSALADHNRWSELAQLTERLPSEGDSIWPELLLVRAVALRRTGRMDEAKALVARLAVAEGVKRRSDPTLFFRIGEMLASLDLHKPAIKLMEKAQGIEANEFVDDRIRQLSMDQQLTSGYLVYTTEHFEIHYPPEADPYLGGRTAQVMEEELRRIQRLVPVPDFKRVVVNVVWWSDFRSIYTGGDHILGFYDGEITAPMAGLPAYHPMVVTIMSHELAHAMIAQLTNDNAPRWFQEGMAGRAEMASFSPNAFNMYDEDKLISLSLIDPVLAGWPDISMIEEGYIVSETIIRYIESQYGLKGLKTLMDAFREGHNTEEAIHLLSGKSVQDFDRAFRAWGKSEVKIFVENRPIIYELVGNMTPSRPPAAGERPRNLTGGTLRNRSNQ